MYADAMAECDDGTRRALVKLNMHCIVKEMSAAHVVMFMPSMAGKKQALLVVASSHTVDTRLLLLLLFISYGLYAPDEIP